MNLIRHIGRIAGVLAGLAAALLASGAAPAFATPEPGSPLAPPAPPVQVQTIMAGGMPGWQIILIAVGAALLAATVAVLADRARAARRPAPSPAA